MEAECENRLDAKLFLFFFLSVYHCTVPSAVYGWICAEQVIIIKSCHGIVFKALVNQGYCSDTTQN